MINIFPLFFFPVFRIGIVFFLVFPLLTACNSTPDQRHRNIVNEMTINPDTLDLKRQPPGTQKMVKLLRKIQQRENPYVNIYLNQERASLYKKLADEAKSEQEKWQYEFLYAKESLNAGNTWEAIQTFQEIVKNQGSALASLKINIRELYDLLGTAYLRLGEQENCLRFHNHQSCIMPIAVTAQHQWPVGSEKAMEIYAVLLKNNPGDLHSRWLYNIAAMTLGKYPDQVPQEWLIPLPIAERQDAFVPFQNIAGDLGIDANGLSGGVCLEDFNGDGFLDIVTSSLGSNDQIIYYENQGDGTFVNKTADAGLLGITGGLNLIHGDYDNDGFPDILVLRGAWRGSEGEFPNSLLKNKGDGTFEDVTEAAGLLSFAPTQTASWVDVDNDGWLDLYIGNESNDSFMSLSSVPGKKRYPCELYLNNRNGTFRNASQETGLDLEAFVKGVSWGDVNNDGYPDVYVSVLGGKNRLFLNKTNPSSGKIAFQEITDQAGVGEPFNSFPTWFWDYDQDGWLDIFVSGYGSEETVAYAVAAGYLGVPSGAALPKLYRNNGELTFTDVSQEAGLRTPLFSMGSNFGDLNNDGFPDFYVGTGVPELSALIPSRMFLNKRGKRFEDVTFAGGFGHLQKGHGIAFGDIDNDGDQDIYAVMGGAFEGDVYRNVLYQNPGNGNNWIQLKLEGSRANRSAIGARIKVEVETKTGELRQVFAAVTTGGSFGASPLQQEIGLGSDAKQVRSVEVLWPDKTNSKSIFQNLPVNSAWAIQQDNPAPIPLPKKVIHFGEGKKITHHH